MTEAHVITFGEVRLSQDALDHIGPRNGDLLTVDKLSGGRLFLGRGTDAVAPDTNGEKRSKAGDTAAPPYWCKRPEADVATDEVVLLLQSRGYRVVLKYD